jgi:hypothetical protein
VGKSSFKPKKCKIIKLFLDQASAHVYFLATLVVRKLLRIEIIPPYLVLNFQVWQPTTTLIVSVRAEIGRKFRQHNCLLSIVLYFVGQTKSWTSCQQQEANIFLIIYTYISIYLCIYTEQKRTLHFSFTLICLLHHFLLTRKMKWWQWIT